MASPGNIPPSLEADFVALRKLRDESECDELKQAWSAEDPTQWECEIRGRQRSCVRVEDGRVVGLGLSFSSLAELPAAIGGLDALKVLDLSGCSSLEKLPDAVAAREGLDVTLPYQLMNLDIPSPLREDLVALRKLCNDDASGELKKSFSEHWLEDDEQGRSLDTWFQKEDPREWNGVMVTDGRVTGLDLKCSSLVELPASIGELKALTTLFLRDCWSLATLPDAIGELGALTELNLESCTKLTELPAAIGGLRTLTTLKLESCSNLVALPDAIGGLRALTTLKLESCSNLVALPAAIGELAALTELNLIGCSSLDALPESIAGLDALEKIYVDGCKLRFPAQDVATKYGEDKTGTNPWLICRGVKRLLANMTRFLDGDSTAIDEPDVKTGFFEGVLLSPSYANRLEDAVRKNPTLADLANDKGQRAIDLACYENRRAMQKALFFLNRYDIADGPPEHRSATSLVVRAVDVAADYGRLFDEFDKDSSGVLNAGEIKALAATLGTTVETFKLADGGSYTRDAFVARFGKERKVVIKIFQSEEQWRNEKRGREGLDARYVVQTIPAPTDDEFAKALGESVLFGEGVGSHAIVMDAADRNLFQIYQTERPDLNKVRVLMRETMECVQHLHEKGLAHGNLKMTKIVRLAFDHRLRLIDLDAAAKISRSGGEYVCSKFSSAILPPECFAKLDADQVAQLEAYFSDCDTELQRKVEPKVDRRGASYVVKTFNLTENGAPKDGLPYELVEASVAVDYWSLGVLLYQLVAGEPLVPSNRDDDCADGNVMAALACWDDNVAKKYLSVIEDAGVWDLVSKLLVRDPDERAMFDIKRALETHPFFNPESGDSEIQRQLDAMQTTLNAVKADTSTILSLSGALELQNLGDTLRNGIEATEVTTPTVFVILKEKLKTKEELRLAKTVEGKLALERKEGDDDVEKELKRSLVGRLEEAKTWTTILADFGSGALKCSPSEISAVVQKACEELVVGEEMFLYLIDELTLEPVRPESEDDVYPIRITTPAEVVSKLLPAMQIGLHALSVVNGAAGIARLFGVPAPRVSDEWRAGLTTSVEILKQESSVEAFSAVNTTATGDDTAGKKQSFRGAALRDLKRLLRTQDPDENFAGLERIGDPSDGTAVWTLLSDPEKVKTALEKQAAERRVAEKISRKLRPKGSSSVPVFTSSKIEIRKGDKDLKARAINDSAVGGIDRYESAPLAAALVDVLDSAGPPVCVGLLAKWGSGKSFLIHQLKRHFDPYARETPTHQLVQWFEEARDGRDAYKKLPPSEREKVEQRISDRKRLVVVDEEDKAEVLEWFAPLEAACLRASDDDDWATPLKAPDTSEHLNDEQKTWIKNKVAVKDRPDQSYTGVLACLLLPFIFCLKLGANSWKALKPYWVDTVWNILLDAWRAFTGFRTHYRDSVELMHNLHIPPPEAVTGRRQMLLPSPPIDIESQPQSQREYIFVDFNAWEFYATEELWTGLLRELYHQVEARLAMTRKGPINPEPIKDWKRKWRAQTAQKKLNEQYGVVGLRARAIVAVSTFLTWFVLLLLAAIGVRAWWKDVTKFIGHAADSVANFISVVIATIGAAGLTVGSVMSAAKAKSETAKSQGDVIFDQASSGAIRNRTSFMHDAKNELNDLFEYMRKFERETKTKLIIVAFVDDLDRCTGGNKILRMLEAVQLLLSIHAAPVITFLAIDPRIVVSSIEESFTEVMRSTHVTGWEYLDKIVQFPVALQQPPAHKIRNLVAHVADPVIIEDVAKDTDGFYRWLADLEFDMNRELIVFPEDDKVYTRNGLLLEYARELHEGSGHDGDFFTPPDGYIITDSKSRVFQTTDYVRGILPTKGKAGITTRPADGHWLIGGSTPTPKVVVLAAAKVLTSDTKKKAEASENARSDQKEEALELVCSSVRKACGSIRILNIGAASKVVSKTLKKMNDTGGYYSFPCGPLGWSDLPELHGMSFDGNDSSIEVVRYMAKRCLSEKEVWGDTKAEGRESWLVDPKSSLHIDEICQKVAIECAVAGAISPVRQRVVALTADVVCKVVAELRSGRAKGAGALFPFPVRRLRWDQLPEQLLAKLTNPPSPTSPTDSNAPPAEATGAPDAIEVVRAVTPFFIKEDPDAAAKPDFQQICQTIEDESQKMRNASVKFEEPEDERKYSDAEDDRSVVEPDDGNAKIQKEVKSALADVAANLYRPIDRAEPPARIKVAEEEALKLFTEKNDGNPRRIKRMVNVFQLARTVASKLKVKGDDTVVDDPRWPLFALKLIKWILLCENYPIRMSLLVLRLLDFQQKDEVNKLSEQHDALKLEFQHRGETGDDAESMPKSDTLISEAYFKYADNYFYAHKDCQRHLQQDGDIEGFALLVSMPLPESTLKLLPPKAALDREGKVKIDASKHYDITVADIVGTEDDEYFGLLKYSFNLTPAIREELSKELSSMLTEHELHFDKKLALRSQSVEHKSSFVMKPRRTSTTVNTTDDIETGEA